MPKSRRDRRRTRRQLSNARPRATPEQAGLSFNMRNRAYTLIECKDPGNRIEPRAEERQEGFRLLVRAVATDGNRAAEAVCSTSGTIGADAINGDALRLGVGRAAYRKCQQGPYQDHDKERGAEDKVVARFHNLSFADLRARPVEKMVMAKRLLRLTRAGSPRTGPRRGDLRPDDCFHLHKRDSQTETIIRKGLKLFGGIV